MSTDCRRPRPPPAAAPGSGASSSESAPARPRRAKQSRRLVGGRPDPWLSDSDSGDEAQRPAPPSSRGSSSGDFDWVSSASEPEETLAPFRGRWRTPQPYSSVSLPPVAESVDEGALDGDEASASCGPHVPFPSAEAQALGADLPTIRLGGFAFDSNHRVSTDCLASWIAGSLGCPRVGRWPPSPAGSLARLARDPHEGVLLRPSPPERGRAGGPAVLRGLPCPHSPRR